MSSTLTKAWPFLCALTGQAGEAEAKGMLGKDGHVRPEHSLRATGDGHNWMCCGEAREPEFSHHSVCLWDP